MFQSPKHADDEMSRNTKEMTIRTPEEDPVDYPAEGRENDRDDEEEHTTPDNSCQLLLSTTTTDQAPSAEEQSLMRTDESRARFPRAIRSIAWMRVDLAPIGEVLFTISAHTVQGHMSEIRKVGMAADSQGDSSELHRCRRQTIKICRDEEIEI
ncbi:hypothetical protein Tco_1465849 [Tanacetum coccineum]